MAKALLTDRSLSFEFVLYTWGLYEIEGGLWKTILLLQENTDLEQEL